MWEKSRPGHCFCLPQFTSTKHSEKQAQYLFTKPCSTLLWKLREISIVLVLPLQRQSADMPPSIKSIPSLSRFHRSHKQFLIKSAKLQWTSPLHAPRHFLFSDFLYMSTVFPPLPPLLPLLFVFCKPVTLLQTICKNATKKIWLCGFELSLFFPPSAQQITETQNKKIPTALKTLPGKWRAYFTDMD